MSHTDFIDCISEFGITECCWQTAVVSGNTDGDVCGSVRKTAIKLLSLKLTKWASRHCEDIPCHGENAQYIFISCRSCTLAMPLVEITRWIFCSEGTEYGAHNERTRSENGPFQLFSLALASRSAGGSVR